MSSSQSISSDLSADFEPSLPQLLMPLHLSFLEMQNLEMYVKKESASKFPFPCKKSNLLLNV